MSAGKRFKFHGSLIQVLLGFDEDSPSLVVSAITQANPAVATITGHGRADGDVLKFSDIVGMTELNDEVVIVEVVDANNLRLIGVNAEGYGAYVSGGWADIGNFSNFCELTGYNRQGAASAEMAATTLCSDAKEFETDLPDFGTTQLDYMFAPRTAIQGALHDLYESGERTAVKITLPKSGGVMVQLGTVQQESEQASTGTLWTGSATIRNTGRRYDVAA